MKRIFKRITIGLTVSSLALIVLSFLYGPLLAWSPLKPGYDRFAFARANVYVRSGDALAADYREIDRMMDEAEAFHRLKFHRPMTVIACKDWAGCARYMPWLNVKGLGGVTLATGDVIYITPRLAEKNLSIAEFLRHELSHALISQNTSIGKSIELTEQSWFSEGLAVWFGRQAAYSSREEFLRRAREVDLAAYIDPELIDRSAAGWGARLAYPAQRYFLEYLKERAGEDRFHEFLRAYIDKPEDYQKIFAAVFGLSLREGVAQYQQALKGGKWAPGL